MIAVLSIPSIPLAMTGEVKEISHEIKRFEWEIPDFFSLVESKDCSIIECPTFFIGDYSWNLVLIPNGKKYIQAMQLQFWSEAEKQYPVEYYFGLKNCDGSVKQLVNGILEKDTCYTDIIRIIDNTELLRLKDELLPENNLTVNCTLRLMTEISKQLLRLDKLSEDFKDFFGDKETCDVILKVKDKEFRVHKSVLMARSSVFAANFKHDMLERQTGVITIPDCDPVSFQEFLDYLYSGKLEELSFTSARNLYYTSNKYDVEELKEFCVKYLMRCLTVENICEVAVFADQYDETQLFKLIQEFFNENSLEVFLVPDWENLMKKDYRLASKLLTEISKMKLKK